MAPGEAYTSHQFRSNANTGPRATPTIPTGGRCSVYAEVTLQTPPQYPYEALLDLHSWRDWNSFNPDVLITKHPSPHSRSLRLEQGTFFTTDVVVRKGVAGVDEVRTKSKEVCMHLEPLKWMGDGKETHKKGNNTTRIRWVSDNANYMVTGWVMKSERVNEIEEQGTDGKTCTFRVWITFSGFAAKNWKKKHERDMQARVREFCEDLKRRCERMFEEDPNLEVEDGRERTRKSMQAVRKSEDQLRALQGVRSNATA